MHQAGENVAKCLFLKTRARKMLLEFMEFSHKEQFLHQQTNLHEDL